jgi:hypothetical protein
VTAFLQVWTDQYQWIPGIPGFKPLYRKPEATVERVHELLNSEGSAWNEQILKENFLEADAKAIQKIPLGSLKEDIWAWSAEKEKWHILCQICISINISLNAYVGTEQN